jgi:hypothetical protein
VLLLMQVLYGVNKLTLQTKEHGQYTHDVILLLQKGIRHVLISHFNPSNPGKGMKKLLDDSNYLLTLVKSTDAIMASYIVKEAKNRADKLTASTGKPVLPLITSRAEAQDKADQLDVINQLVTAPKKVWLKPSPSWSAATSPMPSSRQPTVVTTKASMTSPY